MLVTTVEVRKSWLPILFFWFQNMGILKSIDHVKLTSVNKFLIPAMLNRVLDNAKEDRNFWRKRINMVLVICPIRIDKIMQIKTKYH